MVIQNAAEKRHMGVIITSIKTENAAGLTNAISTEKNKPQKETEAITLIGSEPTVLLHCKNYLGDQVE